MDEEFLGAPILDDQPTEHDALDFAPYRNALVGIVRDPDKGSSPKVPALSWCGRGTLWVCEEDLASHSGSS
jgi:hypothetical protein